MKATTLIILIVLLGSFNLPTYEVSVIGHLKSKSGNSAVGGRVIFVKQYGQVLASSKQTRKVILSFFIK